MNNNKELIKVLLDLVNDCQFDKQLMVVFDGVGKDIPIVPVRIDRVTGDKVHVHTNIYSDDMDKRIVTSYQIPLNRILVVKDFDTDMVYWETSIDNWQLHARLSQAPFSISFTYDINGKKLTVKGIAYKIDDNKIKVRPIHDGVSSQSIWYELDKISNVKIGGFENDTI